MATLTAIVMFHSNMDGTKENASQLIEPGLIEENASLKNENERLREKIADLHEQNMSLKKYLDAYENNFIALMLYRMSPKLMEQEAATRHASRRQRAGFRPLS